MIIGEIIQVYVNGSWYDAEILDVSEHDSGAYVYVYDLRRKINVDIADMR